MVAARAVAQRRAALPPALRGLSPYQVIEMAAGFRSQVPDIIEFAVSDKFLNRPYLFPRQATLLKVIFLQTELFTGYDYAVLEEWARTYERSMDDQGEGNNGIVPDVLERIEINRRCPCGHDRGDHVDLKIGREDPAVRDAKCTNNDDGVRCLCKEYKGRPWFRQVANISGRRGGKGHIGAYCGSYVLWNFMSWGDPQEHFGIDRDKKMTSIVFAGKKAQATANQWGDLRNVIVGAPCFTPYLSNVLGENLTVHAPGDFLRMYDRAQRGVSGTDDMATFEIVPKESTQMAGRGPASFMQHYDEMAHVVAAGSNRSAEEVWESATPSLDQFKEWAFIYIPTSPWQKMGQAYVEYQQSLEKESDGTPKYPSKLMVQLTSWDIYKDWKQAPSIPRTPGEAPFVPLKGAIQEYDDEMRKLEQANPETFNVERRCLDPETRVLMADLTWIPIREVQPGHLMVATDEYGEDRKERRLRTAVVEATTTTTDVAYRLDFDDGTHVVCSGRHRWLSASSGSPSNFAWRALEAQEGKPGPRTVMKVGDTIRALVEPWEVDRSWESGYLSGLYDGEGCITNRTRDRTEFRIDLSQNRGAVLNMALAYLDAKGFQPVRDINGEKDCQRYKITGLSECLRLLGQIRPFRLLQNGNPCMWEGRAFGHERGRRFTKTITAITELPAQQLVDIQTSTGTFIAEGLVSHNSRWATAMDAYLTEEAVKRMWGEYNGAHLVPQHMGLLSQTYRAHGDPSKSGAGFGFAVGHIDSYDDRGLPHVVFDVIHSWDPADYKDHHIDYEMVGEDLKGYLDRFMPGEMTFDQFNSVNTIQVLNKHVRDNPRPKRTVVYERPATAPLNWKTFETFKTALNMGLVHGPFHELADLELRFLQEKNGRVDHPTSGPVQTKDVADCIAIVTYELIGDQVNAFMGRDLGGALMGVSAPGGMNPYPSMAEQAHEAMSGFGRARHHPGMGGMGRGRGPRRR